MRIECGGIKVQHTYSPGDDGREWGILGVLKDFSLLQFYAPI